MEAKLLSVEDVISAPTLEYAVVNVPLWGGSVKLASLTAAELLQWMENKELFAGIRLFAMCQVDGDNRRIGVDVAADGKMTIKPAYLAALKQKDAKSTGRVVSAAMKLCGLSPEQIKSIKNDSGEANPGASPSASPKS